MNRHLILHKEIEKFRRYLQEEEKSENTVEKYIRDVSAFVRQCPEHITKETVIAYKQTLTESGYAVRSINSMLASLNSFFSFIGRDDLRVKALKVQQQAFCSEEKELSKAEYERLCRTAERRKNKRLSLILQTICGTGIRVGELQYVTVEAVRKGKATVSLKGKTRSIFIVRELQKKLNSYCKERKITSGAVFVTRAGRPLGRTNIWREMKSLCAEANVDSEKVFPHNLRHLFARIFYGIEKDIAKLADILGHSSIDTTRIYIISTGTEHRKRMEQMRLIL